MTDSFPINAQDPPRAPTCGVIRRRLDDSGRDHSVRPAVVIRIIIEGRHVETWSKRDRATRSIGYYIFVRKAQQIALKNAVEVGGDPLVARRWLHLRGRLVQSNAGAKRSLAGGFRVGAIHLAIRACTDHALNSQWLAPKSHVEHVKRKKEHDESRVRESRVPRSPHRPPIPDRE